MSVGRMGFLRSVRDRAVDETIGDSMSPDTMLRDISLHVYAPRVLLKVDDLPYP